MKKTCIKCGKKIEVYGPNVSYVENLYLICSACLPLHRDDTFPYSKKAEEESNDQTKETTDRGA